MLHIEIVVIIFWRILAPNHDLTIFLHEVCHMSVIICRMLLASLILIYVLPNIPSHSCIKILMISSKICIICYQVTKFKCGNVCLGVEWHHVLADGTGALHFLNSWAAMARGLSLATQPLIDRTILCCSVPPCPAFHHVECDPAPTMSNPTKNPKSKSMANLVITLDQLNTLKAKANNNETKMKYTSYEILLAHIWRCTCKARGLPFDQETRVSISVDGRSRLHPPISNEYFGNVIFTTTPLALSGEILSESFPQTAGRIQKAIKRMDDEYLRSSIDCLEGVEDVANIMRGPQNSGCPNLAITNWLRLALYETDFGWGPPLLLRPTKMNEGKGYLHPNPANDGSFLLAICLETDPMESFKNIFYDF